MIDLGEVLEEFRSGRAMLLDVRERDEWEIERFSGAISFPLSHLNEGERPELPDDKPVYVHCRKGRRALQAEALLREMHPNVKALPVSFEELVASGFERSK